MRRARLFVAVLTFAAGVVFATTLARATWYAPDGEVASSTLAAAAPARQARESELPRWLRIPALEIRAQVRYVGINEKGNMATPGNFTDTGWYKYGTVPGFEGSAVIDGHVDNALGLSGVFKNLHTLKAGDEVLVDTASSTLRFVVTEVASYAVAEVPLERVFNTKGGAYLNLITCTGDWDRAADQYDRRLVVYTKLAS